MKGCDSDTFRAVFPSIWVFWHPQTLQNKGKHKMTNRPCFTPPHPNLLTVRFEIWGRKHYHSIRNQYIFNSKTIKSCNCNCRKLLRTVQVVYESSENDLEERFLSYLDLRPYSPLPTELSKQNHGPKETTKNSTKGP